MIKCIIFFVFSVTFLFTQEMEVDGNLRVTGNINAPVIDSLLTQLYSMSNSAKFDIVVMDVYIPLPHGEPGYYGDPITLNFYDLIGFTPPSFCRVTTLEILDDSGCSMNFLPVYYSNHPNYHESQPTMDGLEYPGNVSYLINPQYGNGLFRVEAAYCIGGGTLSVKLLLESLNYEE